MRAYTPLPLQGDCLLWMASVFVPGGAAVGAPCYTSFSNGLSERPNSTQIHLRGLLLSNRRSSRSSTCILRHLPSTMIKELIAQVWKCSCSAELVLPCCRSTVVLRCCCRATSVLTPTLYWLVYPPRAGAREELGAVCGRYQGLFTRLLFNERDCRAPGPGSEA
jgi:hypothetical protein